MAEPLEQAGEETLESLLPRLQQVIKRFPEIGKELTDRLNDLWEGGVPEETPFEAEETDAAKSAGAVKGDTEKAAAESTVEPPKPPEAPTETPSADAAEKTPENLDPKNPKDVKAAEEMVKKSPTKWKSLKGAMKLALLGGGLAFGYHELTKPEKGETVTGEAETPSGVPVKFAAHSYVQNAPDRQSLSRMFGLYNAIQGAAANQPVASDQDLARLVHTAIANAQKVDPTFMKSGESKNLPNDYALLENFIGDAVGGGLGEKGNPQMKRVMNSMFKNPPAGGQ